MLYYQVGDKTYYTNVDALAAFTKNPTHDLQLKLEFNFTNQPHLWLTEPKLSVHAYMDEHAKILYDRYRKVHLRYSGGTDSHTLLQSFVRTKGVVDLEHITTAEMSDFSRDLYIHNKADFAEVAKLDAVNSFSVFDHHGLTLKEFNRALSNYKGHLNNALGNQSLYWDMCSDRTTLTGIMENDVVVTGKEKPRLVIENGWWCWTVLDANLSDSQADFDRGLQVWFYMTDDVPELQIKLAWVKLKYLEQIAREQSTTITESWLANIQQTTSMYYQRINHAMGYSALNPVLNSVVGKISDPSQTRIKEYRQWNDNNNITDMFNDYCQDIVSNVRSDFYTSAGNSFQTERHELSAAEAYQTEVEDHQTDSKQIYNISGIWHKKIPITPVSPDLLPI
jgi:hypothetical protein